MKLGKPTYEYRLVVGVRSTVLLLSVNLMQIYQATVKIKFKTLLMTNIM